MPDLEEVFIFRFTKVQQHPYFIDQAILSRKSFDHYFNYRIITVKQKPSITNKHSRPSHSQILTFVKLGKKSLYIGWLHPVYLFTIYFFVYFNYIHGRVNVDPILLTDMFTVFEAE